MLSGVTLSLLETYDTVSVIARSRTGFDALDNMAGKKINRLQLDYTDYAELTSRIIQSINDFGEISLCVSWVHSTAPMAAALAAKIINEMFDSLKFKITGRCDFYEILGSSYANPDINRSDDFKMFDFINYHSVILGFILSGGKSRWLRDKEISAGVIDALNNKTYKYIVGVVEPWDKRP